ncbi:hypothetical protein NK718_13380 [Alsobacter sp. SYSU M60028]|uniref:Uncharacterized protein n=1 Tax=Alsobacter ponti TaxID=2962936 RepID=A0ABT1LDC4_9HYPH|nr:hypothetical protein [Alsobacter ponti]MCP8939512.1 hypothetical protein [Alsobacter ponti]
MSLDAPGPRPLDVGIDRISRRTPAQEVHLPAQAPAAPAFLPQARPLDEVLRRPTLDERLCDLLEPASLDAALLEPAVLSRTRSEAAAEFSALASSSADPGLLERAVGVLNADVALDEEIRTALAALLRG